MKEYIFSFRNAHQAIMGERKLLDAGLDVRVMPMPRQLGSVCGICLRINPEELNRAYALLDGAVFVYQKDETGDFIPWNR